jgi:hypothetical protein
VACPGVKPDNNAVIIAPLKQMIVTGRISSPFSRASASNISFQKTIWRDCLDVRMLAEPALFRQIEVFNSDGTLYKGFPLSHVSSSVADIMP